jgi:hypothetical protein
MPESATLNSSGTMATNGEFASKSLPTSPSSHMWEDRYSVRGPARRGVKSLPSTSSVWAQGQRLSLNVGAEVNGTLITDSELGAPVSAADPAGNDLIVGLQKWVGQINSVEKGIFTAELLPLDHDGPVLFADFDLRLLAPDERKAKPGAILYLTTRMIQGDSGHVEAVTNVRLRQPRRWSRVELNEVKRRGRDRARAFARYAKRGTER